MAVNKNRLSDDKYPMLMDKKTVAEYLGVSKSSVDVFLLNDNLSAAAFEPSKLKRNFFIKTKVNKWLEEL
ncbi:hypothetical protein [Pediococcus pentosaceus]|jgi:hypothetical protein|uniref:DNA-binding protein n=2 Tax=Bacilli TaxID=91061 RepID=A0A1Y0VNG8_PEDPE|nr:hypothetical protein [Pediococcus pentosaceus]ARW19685.1 hypothetical protein S100892_01112 [Pediococcus pentosaceus]KAF0441887.1 hypothetical protein GBO92_06920 [Pediococcus pentosaceus]MBF7107994.1 hypothetical protein [Pediococcus pentosaceus]MDB1562636.1 hypothetical protein [Pediococcus pentosaceus]MDN4853882.1 hypothetical protein [Pediococcus pentosaceus]